MRLAWRRPSLRVTAPPMRGLLTRNDAKAAARTSWRRLSADPNLSRAALLRLGDDADVRLGRFPLAEDLLGLVVGDRAGDDDVLARLPVDRRGHLVLGGQLQRVDH